MSYCPHCNRRLRLIDWRPKCPDCGVNLMFFGFEKRFYQDVKRSELSLAGMRAKMRRCKASYKGSLPAKLRLITCALPAAALLLPMGALRADLPFAERQWSAGLLGLVDMVMGGFGDLSYLQLMLQSAQGALFRFGALLLGSAALAAVFGVLVLLGSALCFISIKRMSALLGTVSVLGALACAVGFAAGLLLRQESAALGSGIFTGSMGYGALPAFAIFAFTAALNFLLLRKGTPVTYAEGDFERAQIHKRVKAGEVSLDDLPFPVVETETTRALEAEIAKKRGGAAA